MPDYLTSRELFARLMPQKEPMLMLDGIVACDTASESGICGLTVGLHPMAALEDDGSMPSYALMEVMAQSSAAILSYCHHLTSPDGAFLTQGVILAVRNCVFHVAPVIPRGTEILVRTATEYSGGSLRRARIRAEEAGSGRILSEALFSVMILETGGV